MWPIVLWSIVLWSIVRIPQEAHSEQKAATPYTHTQSGICFRKVVINIDAIVYYILYFGHILLHRHTYFIHFSTFSASYKSESVCICRVPVPRLDKGGERRERSLLPQSVVEVNLTNTIWVNWFVISPVLLIRIDYMGATIACWQTCCQLLFCGKLVE